jgi:hypothetical protein
LKWQNQQRFPSLSLSPISHGFLPPLLPYPSTHRHIKVTKSAAERKREREGKREKERERERESKREKIRLLSVLKEEEKFFSLFFTSSSNALFDYLH